MENKVYKTDDIINFKNDRYTLYEMGEKHK